MCKSVVSDIDEENATVRGTLQRFLMKTVPRDTSKQEMFLILCKKKQSVQLSHSIRCASLTGNKNINLNPVDIDAPVGNYENMHEQYFQ